MKRPFFNLILIAIVAFIAGLVWMDYHRKP